MLQKRKKHPITLIELMIVILLIGLIGGALAFNMRGSLDEGKAFKSKQNQEKIYNILQLTVAESEKSPQEVAGSWQRYVRNHPFCKNGDVLKDGWNQEFTVTIDDHDDFKINSKKLEAYEKKKENTLR